MPTKNEQPIKRYVYIYKRRPPKPFDGPWTPIMLCYHYTALSSLDTLRRHGWETLSIWEALHVIATTRIEQDGSLLEWICPQSEQRDYDQVVSPSDNHD